VEKAFLLEFFYPALLANTLWTPIQHVAESSSWLPDHNMARLHLYDTIIPDLAFHRLISDFCCIQSVPSLEKKNFDHARRGEEMGHSLQSLPITYLTYEPKTFKNPI
jgi:hypothetical protein